ncbi:MAG TPA: glycosyltransferase family A protein [Rhodopila sp.]
MTISVIVPTYNRADLLPGTLDAIFTQTLPPDEVIVVDDGSQDATSALLQRYAPRVRAIRIANSGDLVARNTGLRAASGDLVSFCDSDDLWRPGFLKAMAALWRAEPRLKAACGNFVVIRDGSWEAEDKFSGAPAGFWDGLRQVGPDLAVFDQPVIERLVRFQPFFPSALVADRAFFLGLGGWDEAVTRMVGTDFATILRLAEHSPIGVLQHPLVGIRKHTGNFSADVQAMNLGDARILEHVLATRPSLAPYRSIIQDSVTTRRRHAFDTAFARRDFDGVTSIYRLLPASARSFAIHFKHTVARLPAGMRDATASLLLVAGSLRSRRHPATGAADTSGPTRASG